MRKTLPHFVMLTLISCILWIPFIAPTAAQPPGWGGDDNLNIKMIKHDYGSDPAGKPRFTDQLPASTSTYGGQSFEGFPSPVALVADDPTATFEIPADATVTVGDVGNYFQVSVGSGSTQTGLSGARVNVSSRSATSTDRLVKVVGLAKLPGNNWGAASGTVLEVRFANHQNS